MSVLTIHAKMFNSLLYIYPFYHQEKSVVGHQKVINIYLEFNKTRDIFFQLKDIFNDLKSIYYATLTRCLVTLTVFRLKIVIFITMYKILKQRTIYDIHTTSRCFFFLFFLFNYWMNSEESSYLVL